MEARASAMGEKLHNIFASNQCFKHFKCTQCFMPIVTQ